MSDPGDSNTEQPEMQTAEDVRILVCDNCGDIVKPVYKKTLIDMMNSLCLECTEGSFKLEKTDLVRRQSAEERIQELNSTWAGRLENAVQQERKRIQEKIEEIREKEDGISLKDGYGRSRYDVLDELEEELRGENLDQESLEETQQ